MSEAEAVKHHLSNGVYDSVLTTELATLLENVFRAELSPIEDCDLDRTLMTHLLPLVRSAIESLSKPEQKISFANSLIQYLDFPGATISDPRSKLIGLVNDRHDGISIISKLPRIPLSQIALLTNSKGEPSLGSEIKAELQSADSVDVVMSFVMTSGVNFLQNELSDFVSRGGKLRLITTTYTGNSDAKAVIRFAKDFGAEVKISYETVRDRLHAKSWIFHRDSGFSSAYVGSSNISAPALNTGSEWNLKISNRTNPELFTKFVASFDYMWNQKHFSLFELGKDEDKLKQALEASKFDGKPNQDPIFYPFMQWEPFAHQKKMLEEIEIQRVIRDRHWNLVVAATGTGKTMLAAFDYQRLIPPGGKKPKLLFVAHKKEILDQAIGTFRAILNDQSFGERFVDGQKPTEWQHVFASIQSLNLKDMSELSPDFFDYVVVDEFHHAEAKTYKALLDRLKPQELLGLTATPERNDGQNVQDTFFDGVITSELRLWDAIDEGLLSPFIYYGIADGTDLSNVTWAKGAYVTAELENVYTANDMRDKVIYNSTIKYLSDPASARTLAFCTSKAHATHTAKFFVSKGIKAKAITSDTPADERKKAIGDLANGNLQMICAVDIFNEGIDIPSIDTVLFLRPTESPLVFLQQLGRGLRKSVGKDFLTVLDFVGVHRAEYRFDKKLRALAIQSALSIEKVIALDQWNLPSKCQIVLDKMAKEIILKNIKQQVKSHFNFLVEDLKMRGDISLKEFLAQNDLLLSDVYSKGKTWSSIRHAAGFFVTDLSNEMLIMSRNLASFSYASDPERNSYYKLLLSGNARSFNGRNQREKVLTAMFFWNLYRDGKNEKGIKFATYDEGIQHLHNIPFLRDELLQILEVAESKLAALPMNLSRSLAEIPLFTHAFYTREELLAAFDYARLADHFLYSQEGNETRSAVQFEGVWYAKNLSSDLFLVTLNKNEAIFSPTVMYKDYAISANLFHWESQNNTSIESPTGKRYLKHRSNDHNLVLAIRQDSKTDLGTAPFQLIGTADVESHIGEKPIQITLKVQRELPVQIVETSPANAAI